MAAKLSSALERGIRSGAHIGVSSADVSRSATTLVAGTAPTSAWVIPPRVSPPASGT
jgi:hypothetical protein